MWANDYIGIPFVKDGHDRKGLDCWRLLVLVYKEQLGIELPDFRGVFVDHSLASLRNVTALIKKWKERWIRVADPEPFDGVLLRTGTMAYHVGIMVDKKRMLHILEGIDSVVEPIHGISWKHRIEGFYRYA